MAPHCPCVLVQRSSHCCPMAILLPSHGCPLDSSGQPSPSRSAHPRFPTKPGAVSRVTSPHGMSPAPASSRRRRPAWPARSRPARAIRPPVFLDQLAARSPDRPRDHRTAGVDVLPSVALNSVYELTDNSAPGVATSRAGQKTTKTALTILSPTISTPVFKHAASFRCWRHNGVAGSDSAFDPHDLWESNDALSPSRSHSHGDLKCERKTVPKMR